MPAKRFLVSIAAAGALLTALMLPARAVTPFILYQGRYLSGGSAVTGTVPMAFRVTNGSNIACTASADGVNLFWTSASTSIAMTDGLFSYKMGLEQNGVTPDPVFSGINWSTATYYIDVCVNGISLNPKELVGSSAYALYASTAGITLGNVAKTGDTMSGALNMNGNAITNLPSPVNPGDAANMSYVQSVAGGGLLTSTNTWSSFNTFQQYVIISTDALITGRLTMNGSNISNLGIPQQPGDAVTKSYVDVATVTYVTATSYSVQSSDLVIIADGTSNSVTITLPTPTTGRRLTIIRDDSVTADTVTVSVPGGITLTDVSCNASNGGTADTVPYATQSIGAGSAHCSAGVKFVAYSATQWLMY